MQSRSLLNFFAAAFFVTTLGVSVAPPAAADSGDKITRQMAVINSMTLQAGNTRIRLWGVKPAQTAGTPIELKAIDMMDRLIGHDPVTCKIVGSVGRETLARCTANTGEDLGLELISHGFAVVDREQAADSVYTPPYVEAEKTAHINKEGVWQLVSEQGARRGDMPDWLRLVLAWGPMGGLVFVALAMHFRLRRMEMLQEEEMEKARRKESALTQREQHVLVSMLESELAENKNRIEAFLTLYGDMLQNLKNMNEPPKYQRAGDIIQKHPFLSKTAFESNMNKLFLLDMKLSTQLSKLYANLPKDQEYINIEPHVSLDTAVALVEKVLKEAEDMIPPISEAIDALEEVVARKEAA